MKTQNIQKRIEDLIRVRYGNMQNPYRDALVKDLLELIKDYGESLIGEEDTLPFRVKAGIVGNNHPQKDECPYCWVKESEFHKADCPILEANIRNQLRQEMRAKLNGDIK